MRSRRMAQRAALAPSLALLAAVLVSPGCYWWRYEALVRTHVNLLLAMIAKVEDLTTHHGVPPASLEEFRYPLERARDFARITARRYEGRSSLTELRALCDAYDRALAAADAIRAAPDGSEARAAFAVAAGDVRAQAARVLAALDGEDGRRVRGPGDADVRASRAPAFRVASASRASSL